MFNLVILKRRRIRRGNRGNYKRSTTLTTSRLRRLKNIYRSTNVYARTMARTRYGKGSNRNTQNRLFLNGRLSTKCRSKERRRRNDATRGNLQRSKSRYTRLKSRTTRSRRSNANDRYATISSLNRKGRARILTRKNIKRGTRTNNGKETRTITSGATKRLLVNNLTTRTTLRRTKSVTRNLRDNSSRRSRRKRSNTRVGGSLSKGRLKSNGPINLYRLTPIRRPYLNRLRALDDSANNKRSGTRSGNYRVSHRGTSRSKKKTRGTHNPVLRRRSRRRRRRNRRRIFHKARILNYITTTGKISARKSRKRASKRRRHTNSRHKRRLTRKLRRRTRRDLGRTTRGKDTRSNAMNRRTATRKDDRAIRRTRRTKTNARSSKGLATRETSKRRLRRHSRANRRRNILRRTSLRIDGLATYGTTNANSSGGQNRITRRRNGCVLRTRQSNLTGERLNVGLMYTLLRLSVFSRGFSFVWGTFLRSGGCCDETFLGLKRIQSIFYSFLIRGSCFGFRLFFCRMRGQVSRPPTPNAEDLQNTSVTIIPSTESLTTDV